jgi:putative radical SAM enzyme (TIGR03279 family)
MIEIIRVAENSIAATGGIQDGDRLISINNQPVNDFLDLYFHQVDEKLRVRVLRNNRELTRNIRKEADEPLGIELAEPRLKACGNNCIFCFIRQNPPGMRRAIYFCDEDYRYSFLLGNYITLTNLTNDEMHRIMKQRLSPLYVSVHATDDEVRRRIFQLKRPDHLLEKIDYLTRNRIDLHTQIVLMPGINDDQVLENTLADLYVFRQSILSVAIVPVGLTAHREKLPVLQPVESTFARQFIKNVPRWDRQYLNRHAEHWVYPSDEFFLLAGVKIPGRSYYGSFYQIENGVGLVRDLLDDFARQRRRLPLSVPESRRVLFVTGTLAAPILRERIVPRLNQIKNFHVDVFPVINNFFGSSVTVAGLLTGRDILKQVKNAGDYDLIVLPPRLINEDGLLLDDIEPRQISEAWRKPVRVWDGDYRKLVKEEYV